MTHRFALIVVFAAAAVAPSVGAAQANAKPAQVPKAYLPPKGMCRIWLDGVAADKQPAPTDCATALKNKPAAGQVLFPAEEPSKPAQSGALRQQTLMLPGNSLVAPPRIAPNPRTPAAAARDTTKAKRDSSKGRKDTLPKKPPPPLR
jgi:hypothetical protein